MNVGRKFKISLRPSDYSEHNNEFLKANDGKTCKLVKHLTATLYITNIALPEGTRDSDYSRGGFLVVMSDKDGVLK